MLTKVLAEATQAQSQRRHMCFISTWVKEALAGCGDGPGLRRKLRGRDSPCRPSATSAQEVPTTYEPGGNHEVNKISHVPSHSPGFCFGKTPEDLNYEVRGEMCGRSGDREATFSHPLPCQGSPMLREQTR